MAPIMNAELREYRKLFQKMIDQDDPAIIGNNSRAHAKVILQELIRSACTEILIQCSHMAKDIYGDNETQKLIKAAIHRGINVTIAVRDACPESDSFCKELEKNCPSAVHCNTSVFPVDFCVVDGKRFRLEQDQEQGAAVASANSETIATQLREIFVQNLAA